MTESFSEEERLAKLVEKARASAETEVPAEDLWPSIRERIESAKVVAMPDADAEAARRRRASRFRLLLAGGAVVAAAAAIFMLGRASNRVDAGPQVEVMVDPVATNIADSAGVYEEQVRILFNRLALERALVRPEALKMIDRDLHAVDSAIAELDAAVARDPNNPVLRRLLASSYREKIDILKRVGNAE
jgi:hypothetical protein